jgi:hypothetical protein
VQPERRAGHHCSSQHHSSRIPRHVVPRVCVVFEQAIASSCQFVPCVRQSSYRVFTHPAARAIFVLVLPEWRNWQTQQTQNLPGLCPVWVRLPPPGPFLRVVQEAVSMHRELVRRKCACDLVLQINPSLVRVCQSRTRWVRY